jgi:hypothetical protein
MHIVNTVLLKTKGHAICPRCYNELVRCRKDGKYLIKVRALFLIGERVTGLCDQCKEELEFPFLKHTLPPGGEGMARK